MSHVQAYRQKYGIIYVPLRLRDALERTTIIYFDAAAHATVGRLHIHRLVPDFILRNYAAGHTTGTFPAVCLFVDISGFSAMTDALMQHGQHGAEVLAQVMRAAFAPLIRALCQHRGFVVAQAGDSFTALFPITEDHQQPSRHALAAAWSIRQRMMVGAGAAVQHRTIRVDKRTTIRWFRSAHNSLRNGRGSSCTELALCTQLLSTRRRSP